MDFTVGGLLTFRHSGIPSFYLQARDSSENKGDTDADATRVGGPQRRRFTTDDVG